MSVPQDRELLRSPAGYGSVLYAEALRFMGAPFYLSECQGYLLERRIPGTGFFDLASPYPRFSCQRWDGFARAIESLSSNHVSVTVVVDPLSGLDQASLEAAFPHVRRLHDHYVVDLQRGMRLGQHHRRRLRRMDIIGIQIHPATVEFLPTWSTLYANLCSRKGIRGLRAFNDDSFRLQLAVPGGYIASAVFEGEVVGADWYYETGSVVYAHLSAYSEAGYRLGVSYPLMMAAIEFFRGRAESLDLGGAPSGSAGSGLAYFKAGWATQKLPSFLCGRVLDSKVYDLLSRGLRDPSYFPQYRAGEFQ